MMHNELMKLKFHERRRGSTSRGRQDADAWIYYRESTEKRHGTAYIAIPGRTLERMGATIERKGSYDYAYLSISVDDLAILLPKPPAIFPRLRFKRANNGRTFYYYDQDLVKDMRKHFKVADAVQRTFMSIMSMGKSGDVPVYAFSDPENVN